MTELLRDIKFLWKHRCFAVGIPVMMLFSYVTMILNPTVGIDDTSFKIYYVDGVAPVMGRWCYYLINKVIPLDHNPYFMELVGHAVFCLSITLWCVVFYRILGDRLSVLSYTIFGCVMLSSPIISEVVIWILHDGMYLGYGATALAVLAALETLRTGRKGWKRLLAGMLGAGGLLAAALGFYESFMIVFLMAVMMAFLLIRVTDCRQYSGKPSLWFRNMLAICVFGMVFREIAINGTIALFHLEGQRGVLTARGGDEILSDLAVWFDGTRGAEEFLYILKDFLVKYYFHAVVYVPIMIHVLAVIVMGLWCLKQTARKKDGWILAAAAGIVLLPWLLPILEGVATYYRSSQYIPLLTAFAVLLAAWELRTVKRRSIKYAALVLAFVLLYRQGYEMNKWLYMDAMKYEDTKRTLDNVALYLMTNVDTGKPVCVVGTYQTAGGVLDSIYTPTYSKKYTLIRFLVRGLDESIFEKYDSPRGYAAAETPQLSFINWASVAFYGHDMELIKFWKMHGYDFVIDGNPSHYTQAREMMREAPAWPREGSVVELEDHIIVNFGNFDQ